MKEISAKVFKRLSFLALNGLVITPRRFLRTLEGHLVITKKVLSSYSDP